MENSEAVNASKIEEIDKVEEDVVIRVLKTQISLYLKTVLEMQLRFLSTVQINENTLLSVLSEGWILCRYIVLTVC